MEGKLADAECRITNERVNDYLNEMAESIREAAIRIDEPYATRSRTRKLRKWNVYDQYDVVLVNSPIPNAGTWGDDFAILHTRLLLECDEPQQLAAILAHEYGHILEEHPVEERVRYQTTMALAVTAAAVGTVAETLANIYMASTVGDSNGFRAQNNIDWQGLVRHADDTYSPFRKKDEYEADRRALTIYVAAGYQPRDFIDTLEMMSERFGDDRSKTHPTMSDRVRRLSKTVGKLEAQSRPRHDPEPAEFATIKTLVAREVVDEHGNSRLAMYEDEVPGLGREIQDY